MLTAALRTVKGWAESFSTTPPSKESIRYVFGSDKNVYMCWILCSVVTARWVAECARPFRVVQDRGYRWLQKEGRPDRYVPSKETVSRDVKNLFEKTKEKIAAELQVSTDMENLNVLLTYWTKRIMMARFQLRSTAGPPLIIVLGWVLQPVEYGGVMMEQKRQWLTFSILWSYRIHTQARIWRKLCARC